MPYVPKVRRIISIFLIFFVLMMGTVAAQDMPENKRGKIGSVLAQLDTAYQLHQQSGGDSAFSPNVPGMRLGANNTVVVDMVAERDTRAMVRDLQALGFTSNATVGRVVSGTLPVSAIRVLDGVASLQSARLALAKTNAGATTSQADVAMLVQQARTTYSVDGTGITVGILSDSYDCLGGEASDISTGDLPNNVVVLEEINNCSGAIDEGRAMAQLVHDLAPGADLLFHSAFNGEASFAQGIIDLANAGADVIVDDVYYFAESFFQDDIIAQAADTVAASNIPFFSSAGNNADRSIEQTYVNSGISATPAGFTVTLHDFDPGVNVDPYLDFSYPFNTTLTFILNWDDPSSSIGTFAADTDYDIFVFDAGGSLVTDSSVGNIGGDPIEIVQFSATGGATYRLAIGHFSGPTSNLLKVISTGSRLSVNEPYFVPASTSFGHSIAGGAAGVAAIAYFDSPAYGQSPPLAESFTALGGLSILFDTTGNRLSEPDVREQPRFAATDGTNTTFFGSDIESDGFPNFFGTSAAAPHAAAVAALRLECNPALTPSEVYTILANSAVDATRDGESLPGYDGFTGTGLVQATTALEAVGCGYDLEDLDVNKDGYINPVDAILVANRLGVLGGDADVDGDGTVTQADLQLVMDSLGIVP